MPNHKYFSHDSDHVVHPGFLASMHKYKDHFKTLHAYYEKQRTDLWLHGSHHSVWPPKSRITWRIRDILFYLFSVLRWLLFTSPSVKNFFIYLLLKSTLVQKMAAVEILGFFKTLKKNSSFTRKNTPRSNLTPTKVVCVFLIVVVSILHHAELGRNNHWEAAPHFDIQIYSCWFPFHGMSTFSFVSKTGHLIRILLLERMDVGLSWRADLDLDCIVYRQF